jgi:hypothetical protein
MLCHQSDIYMKMNVIDKILLWDLFHSSQKIIIAKTIISELYLILHNSFIAIKHIDNRLFEINDQYLEILWNDPIINSEILKLSGINVNNNYNNPSFPFLHNKKHVFTICVITNNQSTFNHYFQQLDQNAQNQILQHSFLDYTKNHNMIEFLLDHGFTFSTGTLEYALLAGCNIDHLQWLLSKGAQWDKWFYISAVAMNNPDLIKWAKSLGCPNSGNTLIISNAITAARNKESRITREFLLWMRDEGFTINHICIGSCITKSDYGSDSDSNGDEDEDLEWIEWIDDHFPQSIWTFNAILLCITRNNKIILDWLYENKRFLFTFLPIEITKIIQKIKYYHSNPRMIDWFVSHSLMNNDLFL